MFTMVTKMFPSDAVCPAGQSEPISRTLNDGERLMYRTQAGRRYTNNVNCSLTVNLGPTCAQMRFFCRRVMLKSGDKLTVSYGNKTKKYITTSQ